MTRGSERNDVLISVHEGLVGNVKDEGQVVPTGLVPVRVAALGRSAVAYYVFRLNDKIPVVVRSWPVSRRGNWDVSANQDGYVTTDVCCRVAGHVGHERGQRVTVGLVVG